MAHVGGLGFGGQGLSFRAFNFRHLKRRAEPEKDLEFGLQTSETFTLTGT